MKTIANKVKLLFLIGIICLCSSCMKKKTICIRSFIMSNSSISIDNWNGWEVSQHPDYGYYWIDIKLSGETIPRLYYSHHYKKTFITYRYKGMKVREPISELAVSPKWSATYPEISLRSLYKKMQWIESNNIINLRGLPDELYIETPSWAIVLNNDDEHNWKIIYEKNN